jgi:hypothetical protein
MTVAIVFTVEGHGVSCKESSHEESYGHIPGPNQKMKMVGHQGPSLTGGRGFSQNATQTVKKAFSVSIILENISALDSSAYDMMQGSGSIYSGLARHKIHIPDVQTG